MASMSLLVHVNENSCRKLSIYESGGGFVITVFVLYVPACRSSPDRMLLSLQKCTLRGIKDKRWNKWFLTQGKCRHSCIMALCDKKREREKTLQESFSKPTKQKHFRGCHVSQYVHRTLCICVTLFCEFTGIYLRNSKRFLLFGSLL